jgi:hypothetical protein
MCDGLAVVECPILRRLRRRAPADESVAGAQWVGSRRGARHAFEARGGRGDRAMSRKGLESMAPGTDYQASRLLSRRAAGVSAEQ